MKIFYLVQVVVESHAPFITIQKSHQTEVLLDPSEIFSSLVSFRWTVPVEREAFWFDPFWKASRPQVVCEKLTELVLFSSISNTVLLQLQFSNRKVFEFTSTSVSSLNLENLWRKIMQERRRRKRNSFCRIRIAIISSLVKETKKNVWKISENVSSQTWTFHRTYQPVEVTVMTRERGRGELSGSWETAKER